MTPRWHFKSNTELATSCARRSSAAAVLRSAPALPHTHPAKLETPLALAYTRDRVRAYAPKQYNRCPFRPGPLT
eukprot:288952-Pyramimonas_sp.AAC.1